MEYIEDEMCRLEGMNSMNGIRGIIREILGGIAAQSFGGGFWTDEDGKLIGGGWIDFSYLLKLDIPKIVLPAGTTVYGRYKVQFLLPWNQTSS